MPERKYAQGTVIDSEKSEMEIRKILRKFGADKYSYYEDDTRIGFIFDFQKRRIKIVLELPDPAADEFVYTAGEGNAQRRQRNEAGQFKFWRDECNRRWRALVMTVKAKLVTVTEGIRTMEQEFLYDIVLPTGQTVGEYVAPQIEQSYLTGKMPPMLPGIGETGK